MYNFTLMQPFTLHARHLPRAVLNDDTGVLTQLQAAYSFEIDTKQTKFESREQSHSFELSCPDSPWRLKLEKNLRKNKIDKEASRYFLLHESLPSAKYSATLSFFKIAEKSMTRLSSELALPLINDRCASFLKFEAKH